jgi:hypothetical protein
MFSNSTSHEHYRLAVRRHGEDLATGARLRQSARLGGVGRTRKLLGAALVAAGDWLDPDTGQGRGVRQATTGWQGGSDADRAAIR